MLFTSDRTIERIRIPVRAVLYISGPIHSRTQASLRTVSVRRELQRAPENVRREAFEEQDAALSIIAVREAAPPGD
jgi:hypothetical protein